MDPGTSLSVIVRIAVLGVPRVAPPVGFDSARLSVSPGSSWASLRTGIVKVLLVSPALKVRVPDVVR